MSSSFAEAFRAGQKQAHDEEAAKRTALEQAEVERKQRAEEQTTWFEAEVVSPTDVMRAELSTVGITISFEKQTVMKQDGVLNKLDIWDHAPPKGSPHAERPALTFSINPGGVLRVYEEGVPREEHRDYREITRGTPREHLEKFAFGLGKRGPVKRVDR